MVYLHGYKASILEMLALGIQAFCEVFAESQLFFILYLASNHIFQEHIKTLKLYQNEFS